MNRSKDDALGDEMIFAERRDRNNRPGWSIVLYILVGSTVSLLGAACWFAIKMNSWRPLIVTAVLLLLANLVPLFERKRRFQLVPLVVFVLASGGVFASFFLAGTLQEKMWSRGTGMPTAFVDRFYTGTYFANDYRQLESICESRGRITTREANGLTYARCGERFPRTYIVAVRSEPFRSAHLATLHDPPGTPAYFYPSNR